VSYNDDPLTSVATDLSSAPVALGQRRAMRSNRMSRSTLMLRTSARHYSPRYHPPLRVDLEDVRPAVVIRQAKLDLSVQSSRTEQRGVQRVGSGA
jgi:hypothetical protein